MVNCCGECKYYKESQQELMNQGKSVIVCTHASNSIGAYNTWAKRQINKLGTLGNEICLNFEKRIE